MHVAGAGAASVEKRPGSSRVPSATTPCNWDGSRPSARRIDGGTCQRAAD